MTYIIDEFEQSDKTVKITFFNTVEISPTY